MLYIITVGDWTFEVKAVLGRKTKNHGDKYSGVVNITMVNGEIHLEGLHVDDFTVADGLAIRRFLKKMFGKGVYISKSGDELK